MSTPPSVRCLGLVLSSHSFSLEGCAGSHTSLALHWPCTASYLPLPAKPVDEYLGFDLDEQILLQHVVGGGLGDRRAHTDTTLHDHRDTAVPVSSVPVHGIEPVLNRGTMMKRTGRNYVVSRT